MTQTVPDYNHQYSSLRRKCLRLPKEQRDELIKQLSPEEAVALQYMWPFWARDEQLAPDGNWNVWLILSGRGWGKTATGANWIRVKAESGESPRIAIIGQTVADVRDVMIHGDSGIIACSPPWFKPTHNAGRRAINWPNGTEALCFSGDMPDQLRGPQYHCCWVDEIAKFRYPQEVVDQINLGLRLGINPQALYTTTPRPLPLIKDMVNECNEAHQIGDVRVTVRPTYDNMENLSGRFIKNVVRRFEGTRLGKQEIHGSILGDTPGALWQQQAIEDLRLNEVPVELIRIVVAVDPEASSGEDAAETGIVVVGLGTDGHAYVLEDCTVKGTPNEWGLEVIKAYYRWGADRIIAEVNNGGEMVEYVVFTVAALQDTKNKLHLASIATKGLYPIAYKAVWAARGKSARAEPISTLYENGIVHHIGNFAELETQMTIWVPGLGSSPDRLDALVWALTELYMEVDGEDDAYVYNDPVSAGAY